MKMIRYMVQTQSVKSHTIAERLKELQGKARLLLSGGTDLSDV